MKQLIIIMVFILLVVPFQAKGVMMNTSVTDQVSEFQLLINRILIQLIKIQAQIDILKAKMAAVNEPVLEEPIVKPIEKATGEFIEETEPIKATSTKVRIYWPRFFMPFPKAS